MPEITERERQRGRDERGTGENHETYVILAVVDLLLSLFFFLVRFIWDYF